jgi:hypothetical protein
VQQSDAMFCSGEKLFWIGSAVWLLINLFIKASEFLSMKYFPGVEGFEMPPYLDGVRLPVILLSLNDLRARTQSTTRTPLPPYVPIGR